MTSAKTLLFAMMLVCLAWSGNALVQTNDRAGDEKKTEHDLPVTVEPFSTMGGVDRAESGRPLADAAYAHESFNYEWIDTSAGMLIPMSDDEYALAIPIGFDFPFHGIDQFSVNVSANGFMSFYAPDDQYFTNDFMPSANQPNGVIAPFWDDLRPEDTGEVRYLMQGTAPDRSFTVTWTDVPHYSAGGDIGAVTFQVTLYESTGDIIFNFQDVLFEDPTLDNGASATIGVENGRGSAAAVFSINSPGISNGDALRFYPLEANSAYDIVPEALSWVDVTGGTSFPTLGDDDGITVPLGFDFPFFGTNYDLVILSSNGYLTFGDNAREWSDELLPSELGTGGITPDPINAVIAPFWDDLNPTSGGLVSVLSQGIAPDRSITLSWGDVPHFSSTGAVTFQTTLHEDGDVVFAYQDVDFGSPELDNGQSASIGIEDAYGTSAARYSFHLPSLNGQSLRFSPTGRAGAVGAGGDSTLVLLAGGSVAGLGRNDFGQLGDLTNFDRNTPDYAVTQSGDPLLDVVTVSSGFNHSLALTRDGRVFSWGNNTEGQLGDGIFAPRNFVAEITGSDTSIAVAAGASHSLALRDDGSVIAWGNNLGGELGNGNNTNQPSPVSVLDAGGGAPLADVVSIAAGWTHSVALRSDGTILAWGANADGQLGNGTLTPSNLPVVVVDNIGTPVCCAKEIAAGAYHSLALMTDGTVMAWGRGTSGQLGDNSFSTRSNPVVVVDGSGAPIMATSVSLGAYHSFAIQSDGQLLSWGSNSSGQLGIGSGSSRSFAGPVLDDGGAPVELIAAVSGGFLHSAATKADGSIWVWGDNTRGQLGFDPAQTPPIPALLTATPLLFGTDLAVSHSVSQFTVPGGTPFNVDITVQNNGPIDALGTRLTHNMPEGFQLTAVSEACRLTGGQEISCLVGLLREDQVETLNFQMFGSIGGSFPSSTSVSAQQEETFGGNNQPGYAIRIEAPDACEVDDSIAQARSWPDETSALCPGGHTLLPVGDVDFVKLYADGRVCDPTDSACIACTRRNAGNAGPDLGPDPCADLETNSFDLFIPFDGLDGEFTTDFSVFDANGQPISFNSPCEEEDVGGVCGGICEIHNCVEITNGYEGDIFIGVSSETETFWNDVTQPFYDTTGPADEVYLDPVGVSATDPGVQLDVVALAEMGYEVFVRMSEYDFFDGFQGVLRVVGYEEIIGTINQLEYEVQLELWIEDPTPFFDVECASHPSCIDDSGPFSPGGIWAWPSDCCYQEVDVVFADSDADGIPDSLEAQYAGTDTDEDNDGIEDIVDNCIVNSNADQMNHDGDQFGDACDDDDDGDTISDVSDNCPLVANVGQTDSDGNVIGDACDGTTEIALCSTTAIEVSNSTPLVTQELQSDVIDLVQGLQVQVQARHAWVGDFLITLTHNGNTAAEIINNQCSTGGADVQVLLDDSATATPCNGGAPSLSGIQPADQPLAVFVGLPLNGTWQLTVEDTWPANDDGIVDNWCLFARVPDADNDGIPDSQDFPDSDGDGVTDDLDNCTDEINPGQEDSNGDGIGNICDGDITGPGGTEDCFVNFLDLQAMKDAFFSNPALPDWNPDADFDSSGVINFLDLQILKNQVFGPPGPSATGCN